ncbi:MAG: cobamide remodeling phosphodiesterase CbiR [Planctomycetota bacterium]|jgi:sugar phosphate isomerase/epimerase
MTSAGGALAEARALKGRFPFRIGATSCVLHADLAANVRALAPLVDDIEIVVFESDEVSPLPDDGTLDLMRRAADEHEVTYTIHLPLDVRLASPDRAERARAVAVCRRVIGRMREVGPFAYVAHVTGGDEAAARESLRRLGEAAGDPALVCVENLAAPTGALARLAADAGASLCFDVGHAALGGNERDGCAPWLERHVRSVRVLHVHGFADGKDHRDVSCLPEGTLERIAAALSGDAGTPRVLTIEVFDEASFARSVAVMEELAS